MVLLDESGAGAMLLVEIFRRKMISTKQDVKLIAVICHWYLVARLV
jgi:hypothetical protein